MKLVFRELTLLVVTIGLTLLIAKMWTRWRTPALDAPYYAVVLTNHITYIGRLEGFGTRFPVLRDAYYIQPRVDPTTKQTSNALVRREAAWHSPTYMILNADQIVMVEPIGKNSKVAELLGQGHAPNR